MLAIVVVGYFTWPQWSQYAEPYLPKMVTTPSPKVQAMEKTIAALESRIGAVEQQNAAGDKEGGDFGPAIATLETDGASNRKQLKAMSARVATLESTLKSLADMTKAAEAGGSAAAEAGAASQAALNQLSVRISQLEGKVTQSADSVGQSSTDIAARIGALEEKAGALEAQAKASTEGDEAAAVTALAVGQLAQALKGSGPFAAELKAVKEIAEDDAETAEAIEALDPRAAGGVPTVTELSARFPAVAEAVSKTKAKLKGEEWYENAYNRLTELVSVRRTGDAAVAAGGTDAALARAEGALAAGDLAAAIQAMETLEPPAADAAAGWLNDARARMTAERLLAILQTQAISLLAAKG